MEKYCVYLGNNNEFVEVFSTEKNAEEYLRNLGREFRSNNDKILVRNVEKTIIGDEDFITLGGTPFKRLPA